jgi:ABC-type transporter MlaC component
MMTAHRKVAIPNGRRVIDKPNGYLVLKSRVLAFISPCLCAAYLLLPTHARADSVSEFVAYLDSSVRAAQNRAGAQSRCRDLTNRLMAVDLMARAAVKDAWEQMTPQQRTQYQAAFHEKMIGECLRVTRENKAEKVTLAGVRDVSGGDRLVTTRFGGEGEGGRVVTWRMRGSRAVDVVANGRSAVLSARQEYAGVLESNKGNADALIAFMRK